MSYTEQRVRELLAEIHDHPRAGLAMPHGFAVERVAVEELPNVFAPDMLTEERITIDLTMPVVYEPGPGPRGAKACLPAHRGNLEALHAAISSGTRAYLRARLREWKVTPEEDPPPYLPDGTPNGPPADWSVTAVLEAH